MTTTMFKSNLNLSTFQTAIIEKVLKGINNKEAINIAVNAVAGSGKSTTIKYIALAAQEAGVKIDDIRITVFGKKNSKDLQAKLGKQWEKSIGTLHSTGFGMIQKELGAWSRSDKIDNYKYEKIARELKYINGRGKDLTIGSLIQSGAIAKNGGQESFLEIVNLLRLTLKEATAREVDKIIEHFQIEYISDSRKVADAAREILIRGQELALEKNIDFTDQIWLPVVWQLHNKSWFKPYKLLCIDEAQDLNAAQLQLSINLLYKGQGIAVYVGDKYQSIMGFAGADCNSWDNIINVNKAVELPLSVCYRCGKEHIKLVNQLFPDISITAYDNNHDGEIIQIKENELDKYLYKGARNIMVVSRKTAPLVSQCIKLISKGIPAQVKGRNIGESLVKEVEGIASTPGFNWQHFSHWIEQYRIAKLTTYRDRENYEQLKETLDDRLDAIMAIYDAIGVNKSLDAFKIYTEDLFSDTDEESVIYLSTVHSAKGLERDDIVIIKPDDLPMSWKNMLGWQEQQEENLHYVALTRAKNRLIIAGDCDWYKIPKSEEKIEKEQLPNQTDEVCSLHTPTVKERYQELEKEIKEYFEKAGLQEPKLSKAYEGVINVATGTMGREDIDERLDRFFSPPHRPAIKEFAIKYCDIREEEIKVQVAEHEAIEEYLEEQREALRMHEEHYEHDGEVHITPDQILVKGPYQHSKTEIYPLSGGVPDWADTLPKLYYPGCKPENKEPNPNSLLSKHKAKNVPVAQEDNDYDNDRAPKSGTLSGRDSAYYGITPEDLNLSARLSPPVDKNDEPTDEELSAAVKVAIARFGPKAIILQAVQEAKVSELAEIMAILDDW